MTSRLCSDNLQQSHNTVPVSVADSQIVCAHNPSARPCIQFCTRFSSWVEVAAQAVPMRPACFAAIAGADGAATDGDAAADVCAGNVVSRLQHEMGRCKELLALVDEAQATGTLTFTLTASQRGQLLRLQKVGTGVDTVHNWRDVNGLHNAQAHTSCQSRGVECVWGGEECGRL